MVKRILLLFIVFAIGLTASILLFKKNGVPKVEIVNDKIDGGPMSAPQQTQSIFVPYWSLDETIDLSNYQKAIYFGVAGTTEGINQDEVGYLNIETFVNSTQGLEKYLTVRMTDSNVNFAVLANKNSQQKIVSEAISIAKDYGFDGIVLDLELFSLFGDEIPSQINDFVKMFYQNSKDNGLRLSVAIYGDVFFRKRPFDVKVIGENSDEVMIMAYDFHKAIGEPGPNFPLEGKARYNYDFKTMIDDFTRVAPRKKLTVIFGMYGYEWTVDEKKRPLKSATSLTLNQIQQKYLGDCTLKNCTVLRDQLSQENEVNYVDEAARLHIVWFEDEDSVKAKKEYLLKQGIGSYSYWAYGYF